MERPFAASRAQRMADLVTSPDDMVARLGAMNLPCCLNGAQDAPGVAWWAQQILTLALSSPWPCADQTVDRAPVSASLAGPAQ